MVNEIGGIGSVSAPRDLGQAGSSRLAASNERAKLAFPGPQLVEANSGLPNGVFSTLAVAKDELIQRVQRVRDAGNALGQAATVLEQMESKLQQVKNYPPYPPGNEQRLDYINSINGLRRQVEAMSFPPVKSGGEPVFYPKDTGLTELDPQSTSDKDLAAYADLLGQVQANIDGKQAELRRYVSSSVAVDGLPVDTLDEPEVSAMLIDLGRALASSQGTLSGNPTMSKI